MADTGGSCYSGGSVAKRAATSTPRGAQAPHLAQIHDGRQRHHDRPHRRRLEVPAPPARSRRSTCARPGRAPARATPASGHRHLLRARRQHGDGGRDRRIASTAAPAPRRAISRKLMSIDVTRMSTPRNQLPARWQPTTPTVAIAALSRMATCGVRKRVCTAATPAGKMPSSAHANISRDTAEHHRRQVLDERDRRARDDHDRPERRQHEPEQARRGHVAALRLDGHVLPRHRVIHGGREQEVEERHHAHRDEDGERQVAGRTLRFAAGLRDRVEADERGEQQHRGRQQRGRASGAVVPRTDTGGRPRGGRARAGSRCGRS